MLHNKAIHTDELLVSVSDLSKSFGEREALRGIGFDVRAGETVALLGPNGAGKTTTINILLGLRTYDSGTVRVFGEKPLSAKARQRLGATLQESSLPATLRVSEVLAYVASHYENAVAPAEIADRFGLTKNLRRQVGGLSGGESRQLTLALAFVGDPDLVFLDEPTTSLDVEARRRTWDAIRAATRAGTTVFLTTHNLQEAEALASRAMVISQGRLLKDAPVAEIRSSTAARMVSFTSDGVPYPLERATVNGNRYSILTDDPDSFVRELIQRDVQYRDLEVNMPSLEDAFLNIVEHAHA
jgi:ABC-2 type transport system ATP-binding protein